MASVRVETYDGDHFYDNARLVVLQDGWLLIRACGSMDLLGEWVPGSWAKAEVFS